MKWRGLFSKRSPVGLPLLALAIGVWLAAGCGSGNASEDRTAPASSVPSAAAVFTGEDVADALQRSNLQSFGVVFRWTGAAVSGGGAGQVVWRQAGNEIRWDDLPKDVAPAESGGFGILRRISDPTVTIGSDDELYCLWFRRPGVDSDPRLSCSHEFIPASIEAALARVLGLTLGNKSSEQKIAGRPAECYSFATEEGTICFDAQGMPMLIDALDTQGERQRLEATTIIEDVGKLRVPTNLPFDVARFDQSPPVPLTNLQFPESFQFTK
jgi:hypothetical protein